MSSIKSFVLRAAIVLSIGASFGESSLAQTTPAISPQLRGAAPTPVAAAYHTATGEVFVASGAAVKIMEHAGGQLVQRGYVPIGAGETILRLRVDARRNRLWVLDVGTVRVFDLTSKKLVRTVDLPNWMYAESENCLPDLQLDPRGGAFVSDNIQRKLWRIDADRFSVSEHAVTLGSRATLDVGFSAMAVTETGVMYAAMGAPGLLWRVDMNSFQAENIPLSSPIYGACALESRAAKGSRDLILFVLTAGRMAFHMQRISIVPGARVATVEMLPARVVTEHAAMLSSSGEVFLAGKASSSESAGWRQKASRGWVLRPVSTQQ
jgi:hypothetical protein